MWYMYCPSLGILYIFSLMIFVGRIVLIILLICWCGIASCFGVIYCYCDFFGMSFCWRTRIEIFWTILLKRVNKNYIPYNIPKFLCKYGYHFATVETLKINTNGPQTHFTQYTGRLMKSVSLNLHSTNKNSGWNRYTTTLHLKKLTFNPAKHAHYVRYRKSNRNCIRSLPLLH